MLDFTHRYVRIIYYSFMFYVVTAVNLFKPFCRFMFHFAELVFLLLYFWISKQYCNHFQLEIKVCNIVTSILLFNICVNVWSNVMSLAPDDIYAVVRWCDTIWLNVFYMINSLFMCEALTKERRHFMSLKTRVDEETMTDRECRYTRYW